MDFKYAYSPTAVEFLGEIIGEYYIRELLYCNYPEF